MDGLRGIAALVVVIEHMSAILRPNDWRAGGGVVSEYFRGLINFPFQAGNFAVYVFFAISGVVVANAAQGKPWPLSLLSRYSRLTIPMLAGSVFAWILLSVFPGEMPLISRFHPNHWTTTIYQNGAGTLLEAVKEALFGAYLFGDTKLNPVLWSMQVELWGSLGIFTFYRFMPRRYRFAGLIFAALAVLFIGYWRYVAFPAGAILYELNLRSTFNWRRRAGVIVATVGILVGAAASLSALRYYSSELSSLDGYQADLKVLVSSAGAVLVVMGVLASETSKTLLTTRIPQFLGRISYSLYLTHMPLLFAPLAALYLAIGQPASIPRLVLWVGVFWLSAVAVAWAMTVAIDEPATRLVKVTRRQPRA